MQQYSMPTTKKGSFVDSILISAQKYFGTDEFKVSLPQKVRKYIHEYASASLVGRLIYPTFGKHKIKNEEMSIVKMFLQTCFHVGVAKRKSCF